MNLNTLLDVVQDLRSQLDAWGLTNRLLLMVGLVSLVLLVWSIRELASWFFKVQALRAEVRELHLKLDTIMMMLHQKADPLIVEVPETKKDEPAFRLDH